MFLIDFDIFAEALFSRKTDDEDDNDVGPVEEDDVALSHVHPHDDDDDDDGDDYDDEYDNDANLLRKMMLLSVMFILIASHSLNAVTEKQFL